MAVPWLQIMQLVPSIVEVSRELLKNTRKTPLATEITGPQSDQELAARIAALEENERRQAELISQMAQQMAGLASAVTALHRRAIWLAAVLVVTLLLAAAAVLIGLRS